MSAVQLISWSTAVFHGESDRGPGTAKEGKQINTLASHYAPTQSCRQPMPPRNQATLIATSGFRCNSEPEDQLQNSHNGQPTTLRQSSSACTPHIHTARTQRATYSPATEANYACGPSSMGGP